MNASHRMNNPRRFAVLDRDGTINVEKHYLSHPDQVELLPGAAAGLRKLRDLGLGITVVTNQSGIARGYFDVPRLESIHERLSELLDAEGVALDAIYFADDPPDAPSNRRKPAPGMLLEAAEDQGFVPSESFVAGDKACDIEMGRAVGATTFLVRTGHGAQTIAHDRCSPHFVVNDLFEMATSIGHILSQAEPGAA